MRAVLSVVGKDRTGIIADVAAKLKSVSVNVEDISQTILQEFFTMIMIIDTSKCSVDFAQLAEIMNGLGEEINVQIKIMHQSIFDAMHRI